MNAKHLKLDWDELEEAFTNQNEELVYFLDLVTGHVLLEGEGEEHSFDDDDAFDTTPPMPGGAPQKNDPTRAYIESPDTTMKIGWLKKFLDVETIETEIRESLVEAMQTDDPAPILKDLMNANVEVRDRWYLFRSDRIRELILEWLTQHGVTATTPAPWDSGS